MKADATTEAAVKAVLNKFADGYAKRDMALIKSVFISDPDVMIFGTGADEKRIGLAQIQAQVERDWSQSESTNLTFKWTQVSANGSAAWVAADASFVMKGGGQKVTLPVRVTYVLEKRGKEWLIAQGHISFPAESEAEGESFPS